MKLLSDQGKQFESKLFAKFCKQFNITHVMASAYHHQTNGKVERFMRFIENSLALTVNKEQTNWCRLLDNSLFTYRVSISRMLNDSPFYLIYGRDPIIPADLMIAGIAKLGKRSITAEDLDEYKQKMYTQLKMIYEDLDKHKEKTREKYKAYYDSSHKEVLFKEGDLVMVWYAAGQEGLSYKLLPHWKGPYEIATKIDNVTYRVKIVKQNKYKEQIRYEPIHVQRLRLYKPWISK
jgi:transposase InsO family protein